MITTTALRTAAGLACAAGSLVVLAACGSAPAVDASEIPLVRPAALAAKDGTQIPLPPQVADSGTPSQRDRYAARVLVPTKLSVYVPAAEQACTMLNGGMPVRDAVATVATREKLERANAERVVYAGTLSWCPKFRGTFDALSAPGARDRGASSSGTSSGSTRSSGSGTSGSSGSGSSSSGSGSSGSGSSGSGSSTSGSGSSGSGAGSSGSGSGSSGSGSSGSGSSGSGSSGAAGR